MIGANEVMARDAARGGSRLDPAHREGAGTLAAHRGTGGAVTATICRRSRTAAALNAFLVGRKKADPGHFADVSLAVLKLMGPGEYVAARPGAAVDGHFGLAAHDYTHSTAPNRRFADLVTQRLLKALLAQGGGALHG